MTYTDYGAIDFPWDPKDCDPADCTDADPISEIMGREGCTEPEAIQRHNAGPECRVIRSQSTPVTGPACSCHWPVCALGLHRGA